MRLSNKQNRAASHTKHGEVVKWLPSRYGTTTILQHGTNAPEWSRLAAAATRQHGGPSTAIRQPKSNKKRLTIQPTTRPQSIGDTVGKSSGNKGCKRRKANVLCIRSGCPQAAAVLSLKIEAPENVHREALRQKARRPESWKVGKPKGQKARKPEGRKVGKPEFCWKTWRSARVV